MKMKIPTSGLNDEYYDHERPLMSYFESEDLDNEESTGEDDFSEYLWMENEEEFDKQVLQQLEEEELMEECLEAMLEEERQHQRNQTSSAWCHATTAEYNGAELCQQFKNLRFSENLVEQSTLNPDAAEFIPSHKENKCQKKDMNPS